ncbi:MAG: hypothetical protein IJ849_09480 [Selenomonadaceae bacterium]|nr:hypothetical protein [Selenomonadaceae bacterium]
MKYEMFDRVLLKTGEKGYIVEIYDDGVAYEVEIVPPPINEIALRTVKADEIEKFIGIDDLKS